MEYRSSFIVFPEHSNHMYPIIFGGKFMTELDLCAAKCVRTALFKSVMADSAVTHKVTITFLKPCYVGDLIEIEADIKSLGTKSLVVSVNAYRVRKDSRAPDFKIVTRVAEAELVFIAIGEADLASKPEYLPYVEHGLE